MARAATLVLLVLLMGCTNARFSGHVKLKKELDPTSPIEAVESVGIRVRIPF